MKLFDPARESTGIVPMIERNCLVAGCAADAPFGYQPNKKLPASWACAEHQHLLVKEAPVPVSKWRREQRARL